MRRTLFACAALFAATYSSASNPTSAVEPEHRRGVEQTFLTFPEWFLVHSPAEFADISAVKPAHKFPFLGHIGQIWSSYASVVREQLHARYPINIGYHVMINVIAISTTAEYLLRSAYENTAGRISWATAGNDMTDEDRYAARRAQEYVDFIRREPWYLFDFASCLKGLWRDVPATGPHIVRKWERRYALTTEYTIKYAYGKLIERATRTAYTPATMTTRVVVDHVPAQLPQEITFVRQIPGNQAVLDLPRYYAFRTAATGLALRNSNIVDIAGNNTVILLTILAPSSGNAITRANRTLFSQPIISHPGMTRYAVVVPVANLSSILRLADYDQITVEHVYDY